MDFSSFSLEKALSVSNTIYLIAVGVAAIASVFIYFFASKLSTAKDAELQKFQTGARVEIEKARTQAEEAKALAKEYEAEISEAKRQAAEAQKGAAEARLELAKLRDPRRLLPEQQDRIIARLTGFAGQKFNFNVSPDPEPLALLRTLDVLLKSAGWQRVPSQMGAIEVEAAGSTAGVAYDSGVAVLIAPDDDGSKPALVALAEALTKEGLPCTPHSNIELVGKTPRAILINVGKKP
jgi:hypothetical protein